MAQACLKLTIAILLAGLPACSGSNKRADTNQSEGKTHAAIDTAYFLPLGGLDQYTEVRSASRDIQLASRASLPTAGYCGSTGCTTMILRLWSKR